MPFPIDIDVVDGTAISDGVQTLTHGEASHIKLLRVDQDGFLIYEVTPPKKASSKISLKDYFVEEQQLIHTESTGLNPKGEPLGTYKYYRRSDGSYYASITGKKTPPHGIELGKLTERDAPLGIAVRTIAYQFGTEKFSRQTLKDKIPQSLYAQKLKSILDVLHKEGCLIKEVDLTSTQGKPKELYTATEKLRKIVLPSPNPEQT